jgi:hypothetical protein
MCRLIGAIVRKQTFVTTYAIGLYIHFLMNLGVAGYFLYFILHATHDDTVALCQHSLKNPQSQEQCTTLFQSIRNLYAGLVSIILVVELCKLPRPSSRALFILIFSSLILKQTARSLQRATFTNCVGRSAPRATPGRHRVGRTRVASCPALFVTKTRTALRCTTRSHSRAINAVFRRTHLLALNWTAPPPIFHRLKPQPPKRPETLRTDTTMMTARSMNMNMITIMR